MPNIGGILRRKKAERLKLEKIIIENNIEVTFEEVSILEKKLNEKKQKLQEHIESKRIVDNQIREYYSMLESLTRYF